MPHAREKISRKKDYLKIRMKQKVPWGKLHRIIYHSWVMWQCHCHTVKYHSTCFASPIERRTWEQADGLGTQVMGRGIISISGLGCKSSGDRNVVFAWFSLFFCFFYVVPYLSAFSRHNISIDVGGTRAGIVQTALLNGSAGWTH